MNSGITGAIDYRAGRGVEKRHPERNDKYLTPLQRICHENVTGLLRLQKNMAHPGAEH